MIMFTNFNRSGGTGQTEPPLRFKRYLIVRWPLRWDGRARVASGSRALLLWAVWLDDDNKLRGSMDVDAGEEDWCLAALSQPTEYSLAMAPDCVPCSRVTMVSAKTGASVRRSVLTGAPWIHAGGCGCAPYAAPAHLNVQIVSAYRAAHMTLHGRPSCSEVQPILPHCIAH